MPAPRPSQWTCPRPLQQTPRLLLAHGGGGKLSADLFQYLIRPAFANPILDQMSDAAILPPAPGRLAFTTDSYVVRPLFFPGGSIGHLAAHGTINDLAMMGAKPLYLSVALILEEGLLLADLASILQDLGAAAHAAGLSVVAGDTKVIDRQQGDGCFITTTGVGLVPDHCQLGPNQILPGDSILISGTIADHGVAVLSQREGLQFESEIRSDTAALHELVAELLNAGPVRMLRDPTRGGIAASLNEMAQGAGLGLKVQLEAIPIDPAVAAACDLLGLDPLTIANEGKLLAIVPPQQAPTALATLRAHPLGRAAAIIGEVTAEHPGLVSARTSFGSERLIPYPSGDLLPRIC